MDIADAGIVARGVYRLKLKKIKFFDDILKHSTYVFVTTSLASALNLLYHLFMVRRLNVAHYGILNSLLAIIMIVTIPASTIQLGAAKFVASFQARGQSSSAKGLIFALFGNVVIVGGVMFLLITIFSRGIAAYLQLSGTAPVISMGLVTFTAIIIPVLWGALQGLQRFTSLGFSMVLGSGARVAFGVILVLLGFGATGALSALTLSGLLVIFATSLVLKKALTAFERADVNLREVYKYFIPIGLSQLCFMSLTHYNIVLVKHFFSPYEAGVYSISSMAGRIILFLPVAIGIVMFPKSSHRHAVNGSSGDIFKKSLIYTGLICLFATLIFTLFPQILILLFSIEDAARVIPLSCIFALSMGFYALLNIVIFHNLATHNLRFIPVLILLTILQAVFICLFHKSLTQVLFIVAFSGALALLFSLTATKRKA